MSLTLVTDRTAADLAALAALKAKVVISGWAALSAAEQAEWNGEHKGAYNASDLNRVGTAIDTLTTLLTTYGYTVSTVPKTDWAENQTPPTLAQMLQYLDDIRAIRQFAFKPTTPLVPSQYAIAHNRHGQQY